VGLRLFLFYFILLYFILFDCVVLSVWISYILYVYYILLFIGNNTCLISDRHVDGHELPRRAPLGVLGAGHPRRAVREHGERYEELAGESAHCFWDEWGWEMVA
jgi:hypothetical protein